MIHILQPLLLSSEFKNLTLFSIKKNPFYKTANPIHNITRDITIIFI